MKTTQKALKGLGLLLVSILSLSMAACGPRHKAQPDCGFVQNVYGERISWKDSGPVGLYIHESFPAQMLPALQKAMDSWARVLGRPVFRIIQTGYQSLSPRQDGVNVIYWMTAWEAEKATEQARTSIYWIGDQIRETDIRVNAKNFTFFLDVTVNPQSVHLESLMLHELGHVLGLKHKDDKVSVMGTYLASNATRTEISQADQENIKCEYY